MALPGVPLLRVYRLPKGPVPSDRERKGHLYDCTVRIGLVAIRKFGECVRRTGPGARNPACCAGSVMDE